MMISWLCRRLTGCLLLIRYNESQASARYFAMDVDVDDDDDAVFFFLR